MANDSALAYQKDEQIPACRSGLARRPDKRSDNVVLIFTSRGVQAERRGMWIFLSFGLTYFPVSPFLAVVHTQHCRRCCIRPSSSLTSWLSRYQGFEERQRFCLAHGTRGKGSFQESRPFLFC